ncbi:DUF2339 domain-containing protein [Psychrobacter sp. DM4]|uniref:DUF2339 domain-containing protein n=1 Tax=Psychrobacter sp. DM4 TaxID=3440637 RepID=UPI003F5037BB
MLGWFGFTILLLVIVVLHNKVNKQLLDLRSEVSRLQIELNKQKNADVNLSTSATSDNNLSTPPSVSPPPLPQSALSSTQSTNDLDHLDDEFTTDELFEQVALLSNSDAQYDHTDPTLIKTPKAIDPDEQSLPIVTSLFHSIKNWFFGGNLVVRVGVLVLLVGVVLLLRLLSDYIEISIESKLLAIGAIGLGLAGLGLKLAKNRFAYGITLQGAGLAIAYLTTFFAYSVYLVLPSLPSFVGLGVLSAITIILAVRQNAFPLALLALSGGFFAPILTSNDTGSLTTLFSYYLLLNVTIAIIAHYRTWKVLNLFGVMVTFGLAYYSGTSYWGISENLSATIEAQRWSLVLLVALHVVLYLFVVIRYAQQIISYNAHNEQALFEDDSRSTDPSRSDITNINNSHVNGNYLFPIDTGLLFSVPLLAFGLLAALLGDIEHALTITSAILAAVYLTLGWLFIQRSQRYALITEGMLALGFGFLALVIPLALDAQWIAFGWSVQGLALVWFGRRSLRAWSVLFGLLLQLVSISMLADTLVFSSQDYPTLALSISAMSYLASLFILRASNSPAVIDNSITPAADSTTNDSTTDDTDFDLASTYAQRLGISTQAASQWLSTINSQSTAFSLVWRSPLLIRFLTLTAVTWALYVLMLDSDHWLADWSLSTTTIIALSALFSLSIYWLINRYRMWQEIRQLSYGLLIVFYTMLILQLPQKFEFNHTWTTAHWLIFAILLIGWLVIGQLWLKVWHDNVIDDRQSKAIAQRSPYHDASWLGTGILVLSAAIHYYLPSSQGVITLLVPIGLMTALMIVALRGSKTHNDKTVAPIYWFHWHDALIGCAVMFAPLTLLWVVITNFSYDGVIWNLPYLPLFNLYDVTLWLILGYSGLAYYLSQNDYPQNALSADNTSTKPLISRPLLVILGLIGFWVISSMLIRTLHAFIGTPLWDYQPMGAWQSEQVQTGLTILWTLLALLATIIASRGWHRTLWFMGIGLLGVVVLKLVLVDLSQTEAIWRVISFIGAGSLILLIGYLAPLPPDESENTLAP